MAEWKRIPSPTTADVVIWAGGYRVCTVHHNTGNNANVTSPLIAAAPELLTACKAMVYADDFAQDAWSFDKLTEDAVRQARTAIAKAEREEPHELGG